MQPSPNPQFNHSPKNAQQVRSLTASCYFKMEFLAIWWLQLVRGCTNISFNQSLHVQKLRHCDTAMQIWLPECRLLAFGNLFLVGVWDTRFLSPLEASQYVTLRLAGVYRLSLVSLTIVFQPGHRCWPLTRPSNSASSGVV